MEHIEAAECAATAADVRRAYEQAMRDGSEVGRAYCMLYGAGGLSVDADGATQLLQKLAKAGNGHAMTVMASALAAEEATSRERVAAITAMYRAAADAGSVRAMCELGLCHALGDGLVRDETRAAVCFTAAARRGCVPAMDLLAAAYFNGAGVTRDTAAAVRLWKKAAADGHLGACRTLGICYAQGRGVPRSLGTALRWFARASNPAWALLMLLRAYLAGERRARVYCVLGLVIALWLYRFDLWKT